jgi:diketogulonate reductase-like aldo/keto reductase
MNLNREPAAIANAAAEEIRALNHRTLDAKAFEQPADVYRTIDALTQFVRYMPQAIEQTWKQLRAMEQQGAIRMDNLSDVDVAMEEARLALSEARRLVATGGGFLNDAAQTLSRMGGQ